MIAARMQTQYLIVIPAKAGTHKPQRRLFGEMIVDGFCQQRTLVVMGPGLRRDDGRRDKGRRSETTTQRKTRSEFGRSIQPDGIGPVKDRAAQDH